jgi:glycosyltransferase involved in cell wall biosynthesis
LWSLLIKIKSIERKDFDVVIVDGGSTDGSVDSRKLAELGVRCLLVNQGTRGLGSQLRIAYSFALTEGYNGVITIDGNDKDDPDDIEKFIQALRGGADFAQASRFIPGGLDVNTPRSRSLAIRLVHAPLLTLASGFKWTDTTQGFRGYSSSMLGSDDLHIFRDVFTRYELLPYLNYRAPRLGFHCLEIGTTRSYPLGEVPTKINGFKGNLEIFKTLVKACLGSYNP